MIPNLNSILKSDKFLNIKSNITSCIQFIEQIIPEGFEDLIQSYTDDIDVYLKTVSEEDIYNSEIIINNSIFNTEINSFPIFMFTDLNTVNLKLNQNQLLHLLFVYRFNQFRPMKRPYLNLITKDITAIMRYINYTKANSYNSKSKNKNLTVVLPIKDISDIANDLENVFLNSSVNESQWKGIIAKNNIAISSVGSMSKSNAVVFKESKEQLYRSPAYKELDDSFISIFKPAQNIPARNQTHILGESYAIKDYSLSIIQQDNLLVNGNLKPKDHCQKEAIVIFHPIENNNRLLSGEIEISTDIADQLLYISTSIEDCIDELLVQIGQTYYPNFKDFVIGINLDGQEMTVSEYQEFTVIDIETTGINSSKKIRIRGLSKAGNCRIISNTGLKGVTKVVNNLGKVTFNSKPINTIEMNHFESMVNERIIEDELKERYPNLDFNSLEQYKPVQDNSFTIKPDLICSMNATKAKSNTITLAQACLAVKLGYYIPSEKFGYKGLLNSLDEKEINEAAQSLPEFVYTNTKGKQVKVFVGLAYISYTEICNIYTRIKPQSFSFEAGRVLATNSEHSKKLYKYIWNNYLEQDKVEASIELAKILELSKHDVFINNDGLPVYNLDDINKLFTQNDLVLSTRNEFPSDSKLLDEDFNKGFFIDLSKFKGAPVIRIPSAKTLKLFSGVLKNGNTIYHVNLVNVSKIIRGCFKVNGTYQLNTIYSKDKSRKTSALAYHAYINTVRSTIYSGPEESQQLIQSLIKPKIIGCNFKQLNEALLPANTVVITNDKVYSRLKKESLKNSNVTIEEYDVKILLLLNKIKSNNYSKEDKLELFNELNKDCPLAMAIRSPCYTSVYNYI